MIIINKAAQGENTYVISLKTGTAYTEDFKVYANDKNEAIDKVADYLDKEKVESLYFEPDILSAIAECSKHNSLEEFCKARELTKCGKRGIYIEIASIEEVAV